MTNSNESFKGDPYVQLVQEWYNSEYAGKTGYVKIDEDGIIGPGTCKALIRALQIELGVSSPNGTFGPTTANLYEQNRISATSTNKNMIRILRGGFLCKGIDCKNFNGIYDIHLEAAIMLFRSSTGIPGNVMDARHMKALLNTDPFVLSSSGANYIQKVQQFLNKTYSDCYWKSIGLIPCNGIPERNMTKAIVYALQYEEAVAAGSVTPGTIPSSVDGIVGTNTLNRAPVLSAGSDKTPFVKILQAAITCMCLKDVGIDGIFDSAVSNAVSEFQKFMCLDQNSAVKLGTVCRKTWASFIISKGDTSRYAGGCDCSTILDLTKAQALKDHGYHYVGRYLTGTVTTNKEKTSKALTLDEINAITTAGLKIFAIYQDGGASATYFSRSQGYFDAQKAYEAAKNLHIPLGEIIYFAVDYDFTDKQTTTIVIPHFQGINAYFKEHGIKYRIGIYGSRNICSRVSELELACSSFVSDMSSAYSGNMGFRMPENWAFDQIIEYDFTCTDHQITKFSLDRDVVSGRYTGFDGTMLCGGASYADITLHDMEYLNTGYCRCKICGYQVPSPLLEDGDILNEEEQMKVTAAYTMFLYYAAMDGLGIIYSNLNTTAMLLNAIKQVRAAHPHEYSYSDKDGICQIPPYQYVSSPNDMFMEFPLAFATINSINIAAYNGCIPVIYNAIAGLILPQYGTLMSYDDIYERATNLNSDNFAYLLTDILSLLLDKAKELSPLKSILDLISLGISLEETNECKIQPEDCVVSYPIYQGETTTVDSLVVFTPEHRLKMLVLNDFVNRGTEIATTSTH